MCVKGWPLPIQLRGGGGVLWVKTLPTGGWAGLQGLCHLPLQCLWGPWSWANSMGCNILRVPKPSLRGEGRSLPGGSHQGLSRGVRMSKECIKGP